MNILKITEGIHTVKSIKFMIYEIYLNKITIIKIQVLAGKSTEGQRDKILSSIFLKWYVK